ncbi:obscurin isoform X4 [Venturia canescens]|uniref:obscurin isoform X4 n=1 Tax=Venturia canescens TaxID=32260 RepID=UPI001C9BBE63|nr:obscurin isoform X4 [Venturia canescens]
MSFCRITGRSRGLPKPNYFPLLPPISPADAKRFCRITGKSYGLPTHHYIPVLLGVHTNDKSKCRITNVSDTLGQHHYTGGLILGERKKHVILKDYRYVFPVLKDDDEQQKVLRDLLSAKETRDEEKSLKFVYTVDERRCSLVFPAKLEAAVRDGDVRDVMLSRDCDTVLLRLKQGKNVSVDFRNLDVFEDLYDGLGPRQDVLKEREKLEHEAKKRKRKRAAGLSYAKKIFEDKEKVADEEELRKTKQLKLRSIREETRLKDEEKFVRWKHIDLENARSRATQLTTTSESRETIAKHLTTSCDWREIDGKAEKFDGMPLIDKIPTPVQAEPEIIDLEATEMGAVISPISTETGGLEAISVVKPFVPLNVVPDAGLQHALETIPSHELEETADVTSKFLAVGKQALEVLPRIEEIPELVKNVGDGKKHTMHNVKGLKIDVESAQRFVTGQTVETPSGPIFVPGQTLKTPKGNAFVPGFTVHTPDGPLLIPGQIVTVAEKSGEKTPVFVAGQTLPTKCGQRFVQGQTIHTSEGARFVTGQTVLTEEGPKFVAGQIVTENNFVPGQTVLTPTGARFMPGQTVTDQHGEHVFMPGQSVEQNGTWTFIAGQCLASSTGESMFVPGRTLVTPEGPRFVAGQDVISNTGQSHFVPGIAVDSNGGLKFVPGTTLETPQGPKFVEGQMMKTPDGVRFVPGSTTSIKSSGTFEFAAANSMNDLVFMEATPTGIPVDPKTASAIPLLQQQEVYGHMVQTDDGVEFIPEWTQKYPEGKRIVPGQLVRGGKDSPRFVPGVMTEEGFLPGQIVMTEKGEQFVPGQVVDTSTGPKFVPGRMVETRSGSKFVPGQTVETEDGPRFVPGQIVQTKVGPTFIPGQVISMEDEGSRFVPGQVVDTPEGPRFVPGRVVESGKHGVTFVPGQIVQTEEGPRFVAPDLTDTPEGEMEFSVQGFEVTPEELGLLRPQHLQYNARSHIHQGETSIDARMLRQLSEAGMSVGRKVPANLPNVDVDVDPTAVALEHALVIAEQLGLRGNSAIQMAQVTSTISQLANNIVKQQQLQQSTTMVTNGKQSSAWLVANGNKENGSGDSGVNWLTEAVKASIAAAVLAITDSSDEESLKNGEPTDQSYVLSSISEAFNVVLRRGSTSIDQSVSEVLKILLVSDNRTTLCQEAMLDLLESSSNKIDILKSTVVGQTLKDDIVMERLSAVLDEEVGSDLVGSAFRNVSRGDPELVSRVLQRISQEVGGVATEKEAAETLHKAIVHAVGESSELRVKELLSDEGSQVRELLLQAVGLARALGMSSTASSLLAVISDDESTQVLAGDKLTLDILKRLTVMRKLAEERPQFVSALRDLCSDPELARTDPRLRTLVRESAALMIVPEEIPLKSSVDVPSSLLRAENSLAMEEFLMRRRHGPSKIFMILKQGIQAVVPREASRAVLTGQVAYTVLDENGITYFEPLHVFSALRLNKPAAHRFSMYACPVAGDEDYFDAEMTSTLTIGSVSGTSTNSPDGSCNGNFSGFQQHYRQHQECATNGGVTLTRSDRTEEISSSPENTPSFRKLSSLYADSCYDRKSVENFIVIKDYVAEDDEGFSVNVGDIVEAVDYLHDSTKALVRKIDGREGWLPVSILMQTALSEDSSTLTSHHRPEDSQYRREAVVKELVETEEEFGRDIQQVVERYLKPLDTPGVPRTVRDNKEIIFTNLKQIADFHNTSFGRVLIEGVKYYADQPRMLGKTFLRLERDFDKHVAYCRDEPAAQELLQTNEQVREYFEELSQTLGDDKSVSEHLKLPIQRINDYQLLLKELVKYSTRLGENCDDLQKALELMLGIPHRATDNKFISNIEGYKGNIHKLGRLLTHEWFTFIEKDGKSKERYLFLFKARILVCKVRRISDDRSVFVLKDIIKLPEVEVKDHPEDLCTFELHSPSGASGYPLTLVAHKDPVKKYWLKEIREYASDQVALAEHAADDLQLSEVPETGEDQKDRVRPEGARIEPPKLKPEELKTKTEPSKSLAAKPEATKAVAKPEVPKEPEAVKAAPKQEAAVPAPKPETVKQPEVVKPTAGPEAPKITEVPETKAPEKRRDSKTKTEDTASKKIKTEEEMSGQFSASSRFSASTRVVEEYSSVSSSRNAVSSYVESSVSTAAEKTSSSSYASAGKVTETSSSYESAVSGSSMSADTKVEKLALSATETGRPVFVKTIEGSTAEPMRAKKGVIHIIAGENASFECTMASGTDTTKMQWFKDNKPLSDKLADRVVISSTENTFKLTIKHVLEADSGIYTARAANGDGKASCTAQLVVQNLTPEEKKARAEANAPIFLVSLKDTELLENTYLRFMIKVKGDPNPELKFFKDDVPIDSKNERVKIVTEKSESGFYEVVISDVQKQDAGKYSCKAKNRFGEASSEATVSVTDEKTIFAGLPEGFLEAGTEPNFKWLRDGKPFDPEERFKVLFEDKEDTLALVFQHVKPEDAGLYTCVAQTNTGNISCSAELTVQGSVNQLLKDPAKPALGTESKQSEVSAGGSAMLDLQVKGYPKPDITWTKDGQEIVAGGRIKYLWEDEESLSLVIKNVTVQDAGTYVIRAKNELGEDTTQIELIVKSAPKFVKKMSDFSSYIEQDVSMSVQIAASPAPDVKWYKDGQLLQDSDRITIKKETNDTYTLNIREARLDDAGSYSVVAKNEISQTSEFWKFDVKCPPKITKKLGESRIVNEGETLNLQIEVETFPEPTVVWLKDEEIIVETERIKITSDGGKHALKITGTVSTDAATYKAVVTNKDGKTVDQTGIEVRSAPRFKTQLSDVTAKEGDVDVALEVEVGGFPRPSVQWYIGDVEITETRKEFTRVEEGDNYKLIIKEVKTELSGKYTCKLKNEYGVNSSSSNLTVNCRPKIVKKLVDVKCKEGETLKLKVEISGTPDPEIKWFKDGEVLEVSADARIKITRDKQRKESYDLTLNLLKGSDGGVYEVKAENEMGSISCKSKVIVLTKAEEAAIEEAEKAKKAKELEAEERKRAEEGPEGPLRTEKQSVQVIKGEGDTITISVASTTTHEALLTGPDERHTISKMTSTKVEFQELSSEGPKFEEIASYSYTLHEDSESKPSNGMLIEEYSESDENSKARLKVNRGVSIVSMTSDDESTLKALSRDVSSDDIHNAELGSLNGIHEEIFTQNGKIIEEKSIENETPYGAMRYTETIMEERSIEESLSGKIPVRTEIVETSKTHRASIVEGRFSRQSSKETQKTVDNDDNSGPVNGTFSRQSSKVHEPRTPEIQNGSLSRQSSKISRVDSSEEEIAKKVDLEEPQTPQIQNGNLSRQSSKISRVDSIEEKVAKTVDLEEPRTPEIQNGYLSRQSSKISRVDSTEEGVAKKLDLEEPQTAVMQNGKLSRESSKISRLESAEEKMVTKNDLPKSEAGILEEGKMSRQSSKIGRSESVESSKGKIDSVSRQNSQKATIDNDEDIDPEMEALFDRIKRQRSVLSDILDKEGESEDSAAPAIVSSDFADCTIYETQSATFTIKASGLPRPDAKWFKDGKPLRAADKAKAAYAGDTHTLTLNKAMETDTALYQLVLTNKLGEKSIDAFIEVGPESDLRKANFTTPLADINVEKDGTGVFTAVLTADPVPDVVWSLNGKEISPEDERIRMDLQHKTVTDRLEECTITLTIPNCGVEDIGKCSVKASNKWGEASCSADLDLLIQPEILEFKDINAAVEEPAKWEVTIKSNPKANLTWEKDGQVLDDETRFGAEEDYKNMKYRLVMKQVQYEDAGRYKVTATNYLGEDTAQAELIPYTEPPTFVQGLVDGAVRCDLGIEFKIEAAGIARPKVKWYLNGDEIVNDSRHTIETRTEEHVFSTLKIRNFEASDEGELSCVATNLAGKCTSRCNASMIRLSPTFESKLPRSAQIDEGQPLELTAQVDGSPYPTVAWYKDGEKIVPDEHVKIEKLPNGLTKLTIDKVLPTDSGAYKLVAKNSNGENSALCAVAVKPLPRKPSFEKPLEDVHVVVGEPLKLEAQVVAFPSPELQWFKDGLPIRPSKEIEFINEPNGLMGLSIDEARASDSGTYALVASNKHGEITGTANVEVEEKEKQPGFLATLHPVKSVEGFAAKLEIKTVGKPKPTLKWTHNGEEIIPDGKHLKIIDQPDGTQALLIEKVRPEDGGDYEVVAENSQGAISSKGSLEVIPKGPREGPEQKPSFLSPMRDVSVEEGDALIFSVPFAGNPIPEVSWTKDGKPLECSDRAIITCDGSKIGLEIYPSEISDGGTYGCELKSPLGDDRTSAHAIVRKVYQKPHFTQTFTDLQQVADFDAKFMARVSGVPMPDIAWYFNDKPIIRDTDKYKIKRDGDACCLYIRNCASADTGRYKCKAVNKDGEAECQARLIVVDEIDRKQKVEPPSFLKKIGDCEVYKGMTAKFTACVTGNPEPAFEWYRNDERVWPTDRIKMEEEGSGLLRLIIQNVEEHDVGKYSLRIYNPHGEETCHAEIRYETLEPRTKKPLADQYQDYDKYRKSGIPLPLADRPIISRMMDRHLTLSWRPSIPIGPRVPVTYLVEMCELPDGDWFTARTGIRSCVCDIRNLEPFRDYKFRIRVENKYGISDPSPFAQTYRAKLEPDPPKFHPYLPPGIDFRPETSPYFPKDFDIERPPHDGYAQVPRFLRQEFDTQYGVKNHNCNLFWFVYGYPKPKMTYYFNNELIESGGGRYDQTYTRNGQATLFINKMLERDVGMYEAVATNEHGQARQRVRLQIAEYPTFVQRPEETVIMMRRNGQIQARIIGIPYPEIKWYKDWKPITETSRIKIVSLEPDISILILNDVIAKDTGLYSISARNVAGSVSSSAMIHIEDNEHDYGYRTYTRLIDVKPRAKPLDDFYDLGDELGRGTQGITYHAVERTTGNTFAAKVMHGKGEVRPFMYNEMSAMNHLSHRKLLRLHDAFETDGSLTLVMELAGGGELVDNLTKQSYYTEYEIAGYIRQVLQGLHYIHDNNWAHLGLTLGDLLISHPGGDDLKIGDFGLARRIAFGRLMTLVYGMPEYVAPEVANGEGVSYGADMWSLGIITYILLSGVSPFRGINDRETLTKIKEGHWEFEESWWCNISEDARDFITRLLCYTAEGRLDVVRALRHPWLNLADKPHADAYKIPSENLKNYYKLYRDWYSNASCRTWYRRRRLSGAFEHPSKMVYPPGQKYTPEPSPERSYSPSKKPTTRTWENRVPSREPIDTEIGMFSNESHYQNGPDTYLLQLRDTDFPVRLREYMKVANNRGAGFARTICDDNSYDWRTPIIRERRRFTDVMDEEIDDERKARINNYGANDCHTLRRLRHELGTRLDSYAEAEAMMETKKGGNLPFFREKPQILPIEGGKCAQLCCLAVGNPRPAIQWFKNDLVIQEGNRIRIIEDTEGRSMLSFNPAREHDVGIYKVVARNKVGQTVARTRVVLATVPGIPNAPEVGGVSDTEVLLRWKPPKDDGNSEVLCYNLQYKAGDAIEWIDAASNIDHEFFLVRDLVPETSYNFRLAARNRIGWSEKGLLTNLVQTKPAGTAKLQITRAMRHLQALTESGQEIVLEEDKPHIDYSVEDQPLDWTIDTHFTERYSFISEVCKGQFSRVVKGSEKLTDKMVVAKLLDVRQQLQEQVGREFQALRSLRHERIAILEAAYWAADSPVAVLILEKLQGADVLTYLASRHEYTENCVATIITQVLDGLQYLHWRGYCHLNIQPDNVVMASLRSAHVKIVDMGEARKVSKLGTEIPKVGHPEYRSPEVENEELCYPQTDIWSVAVLGYVLMSGASPFRGGDHNETRQNISFVRYRFEYLFKEISQEATRFLMLLFKRTPSKRPTAEECHEHRWLLPTEFMIRKRERAIFPGSRLKNYNEEYHQEKNKLASSNDSLAEAFGAIRQLNRSNSIQDELITSYEVEE